MNIEIVDEQAGASADADDPLSPGNLSPGDLSPGDRRGEMPPISALRRWADVAMTGERLPADTELTITLVDSAAMTELNETHMGKTGPTDVLSFPIEDMTPGVPWQTTKGGPPLVIGDIFICPEVVLGNAAAAEVPFADEMALMVVHGVLHLLGYDHVDDTDAELMETSERTYLEMVGLTRP